MHSYLIYHQMINGVTNMPLIVQKQTLISAPLMVLLMQKMTEVTLKMSILLPSVSVPLTNLAI